jgi:hypothetical protein
MPADKREALLADIQLYRSILGDDGNWPGGVAEMVQEYLDETYDDGDQAAIGLNDEKPTAEEVASLVADYVAQYGGF